MSVFSERLKLIMDERSITQINLCEMTGIPKSAVSQYLSDKFKPKRNRTYIICRALNISPAWLMGLSDDKCAFEQTPKKETLTPDEQLLINFCREHPKIFGYFMNVVEGEDIFKTAFRAAKSEDGSIAPGSELLTPNRKKILLDAPETKEDI